MQEFPKRFDFGEAEARIYQRWLDEGCFNTAYDTSGKLVDEGRKDAVPYTIAIPPPNITGRLHMGHALNNTVQDALIRYKRMDGFDALWVPGTDHAGIATQTVVKKQLDAQGIDFRELGRDKFIEQVWEWKEKYGDAILAQLRALGASVDWSRLRFTMDEGLNAAVRKSFVTLYEQGLIYRGKRIVNWCPVDRTALSDDEVEKEDEKGKMYHIRYPFEDNAKEWLIVATTRPETLFGDVAVAVNPDDDRFKQHIGRKIRLPLQGRIIPVIGDEHADPTVGTGCVKITPAHDPNDFEVGDRHNLERINVMNEDASMNEIVPEAYQGLDRYKARKKAIEDLEEQDLLEKVEDHVLAIGRSYRSKVPIEFRLSDQWFVNMDSMAADALEASGYQKTDDGWVKSGDRKMTFHPERFEKIYYHWLSNIRDWCISRQIWWGHRIPAWFHKETGEVLVAMDPPEPVKNNPDDWHQETDVLDTWFSSWLWPMSILGWPEHTPDFKRYYPTSTLSTAKDILFFWVARMNFAGLHFEEQLPYRDVYLHSTIADDRGITMSKSKGNGIDPLSIIQGATNDDLKRPVMEARPGNMKELLKRIEKNFPEGFTAVGADALRWTLLYSITDGEHVRLSLSRFTEGRNFITKLWNGAGRIIQSLEAEADRNPSITPAEPTDEDRWILARLDTTIRSVRKYIDRFDFGAMSQTLYHFVWNDFCAWSLELSKTRLTSDDASARLGALRVMGSVLTDLLRLLHPSIPFVTEELFGRVTKAMTRLDLWLDEAPRAEMLVRDRFPQPRAEPDPGIEARFGIVQRFVVAVRQLRSGSNIKDNVRPTIQVKALAPETKQMLNQAKGPVCFLARIEAIEFVEGREPGMAAQYDEAFELYLDLKQYVDLKEELARLDREIGKAEKEKTGTEKTLANPNFVKKAPPQKVADAKAKLADATARLEKLLATKAELDAL